MGGSNSFFNKKLGLGKIRTPGIIKNNQKELMATAAAVATGGSSLAVQAAATAAAYGAGKMSDDKLKMERGLRESKDQADASMRRDEVASNRAKQDLEARRRGFLSLMTGASLLNPSATSRRRLSGY